MDSKSQVNKIKIYFIINPISGNKKKSGIKKMIFQKFDTTHYDIDIRYTEYRHHASLIARTAADENADIVVAIGGDGTVNEVARSLINTNTIFGIVPMGSGNGLSRFFKIPMNPEKALQVIKKRNVFKMDAIQMNDEYFVNMAGLGFDAHISHLFANYGKRGFISYLRLIIKEFFRYKNYEYQLNIEGKNYIIPAFLISFANSSQFGNEAHIAPVAEINDGLIDICILKKFPWWKSVFLAILLYSKGLTKSKYYKVIKAPNLEIINSKPLQMHIDGDPLVFDTNVKLQIIPQSLNIAIP